MCCRCTSLVMDQRSTRSPLQCMVGVRQLENGRMFENAFVAKGADLVMANKRTTARHLEGRHVRLVVYLRTLGADLIDDDVTHFVGRGVVIQAFSFHFEGASMHGSRPTYLCRRLRMARRSLTLHSAAAATAWPRSRSSATFCARSTR